MSTHIDQKNENDDKLQRHHVKKERDETHQGSNLKRFREMLGVKQEALAFQLGPGWSQKRISLLEGKAILPDADLEPVAEMLNAHPDIIRLFSERVARESVKQLYSGENKPAHVDGRPIAAGEPGDEKKNSEPDVFFEHCQYMVREQKRLYEELLASERRYSLALEKLTDSRATA